MPKKRADGARRARPQRRGKGSPLYAAIDLGTNNCRLLIARREGETFRVVDSYSQTVRLGEGLGTTGRLSDAAMARCHAAFKAIQEKLKQNRVAHVRCVATEACRKAENGKAFIAAARETSGLAFRIISAREEAKLAAIGCHDLIEPGTELVLVLDIGGGSTEIAFIDLSERQDDSLFALVKSVPIKAWGSFPLGVVTLTERFQGLPETDMFEAMYADAYDKLSRWKAGKPFYESIAAGNAYMIGTSGTVTCLAGIHLGLEQYRRSRVDGMWIGQEDVMQVINRLHHLGREGRIALPTVGYERADLMMSGCAILKAACTLWPGQSLRVADRGLREGLLLSMMHGGGRNRNRKRGRRRKSDQQVSQTSLTAEASPGQDGQP